MASCPAGQQLDVGHASLDSKCSACATGKYQSLAGGGAHQQCQPFSALVCPAGQEAKAGTSSQNVACGSCDSGKFTSSAGQTCQSHGATVTSCAAGYESKGGSSTGDHRCQVCGTYYYPAPARTPALPGSPVVATATGQRLAHFNRQRILHASADLALPMQPLGLVWDLLEPGRLLGLVAPSSARTGGR